MKDAARQQLGQAAPQAARAQTKSCPFGCCLHFNTSIVCQHFLADDSKLEILTCMLDFALPKAQSHLLHFVIG